ncbi:MAG TPA: hypothetical protein VFF82_03125 [Rhodocyclaceae bacterium]|nr:hypothetical protein [Rhodocyclaceae bacterium]
MAARDNDRLAWLFAGILVVAWAAGSHYLVATIKAGIWIDRLYLIQHVGMNVVLGVLFGRSLLGTRTPLVTVFASRVQKVMTPELLAYTRQVTLAWTLFFVAMATLSILLYLLTPIEVWSTFANILTLPLVAAMFVVENEVRKRVLPPDDQVGILAAVRAFRAGMRS